MLRLWQGDKGKDMASISNKPNGRRWIQFTDATGKRKTLRLGKVSLRHAESVKVKVNELLSASVTGAPLSQESSVWLKQIDSIMYEKLAAVGLVRSRARQTLGPFLDAYIKGRKDIKEGTRINLERIKRYLVDFFGEEKKIRDITAGDAEDFRQHLIGKHKSQNTVRRSIGRARQFMNDAMKRGLIDKNPFEGMAASVRANHERFFYVTREMAQKVLDACPDVQWRLIFAFARFGGMRCPSEVLSVKWEDINWEHGKIRVPSPKTEHHEGGASRLIPMFPELRPLLLEAFEEACEGDEYVIARYRSANSNLRTQLHRIIRRAGLEPWPKAFQNLRSTRETELAEEYPIHVVCKWIGNTQAVAATHYLQTTDEHFARAARENGLSKATQNPTQKVHETPRNRQNGQQEQVDENPSNSRGFKKKRLNAVDCERRRMTGLGLEPRTSGLKGRCSTD